MLTTRKSTRHQESLAAKLRLNVQDVKSKVEAAQQSRKRKSEGLDDIPVALPI